MIINLELDSAAQAAPAAVQAIWQEAANIIGSMFTDNITVNLSVDWSGTGGGAAAGPAGGQYESYSTVYNYLKGSASPGDSSFDYLPTPGSANAPTQVAVWDAQLKAMGLLSPTGSGIDGDVFFDTDISQSSLLGVALHEFTHALGRVPFTDGSGNPDIMEFDRFTSVGNRLSNDNIPAPPSYFSLNGGTTDWAVFGQGSDPSDYLNSENYSGDGTSNLTVEDAFNEFYDGSTLQYLTPADLEQMDVLGFHLKEDAPAEDSYDFNGQNSGDILLQNASGQIEYVNMAGGSDQGIVSVANTPGWTVVGEGKISGGVDSDIVIQNNSTSEIYYRDMLSSGSHWVDVAGAPGYSVVGVGDINDDHYADIVIQNHSNGTILYANMDNGVFNGWENVGDTPGWNVVGVADVKDSGYDDVIIQNQSDGTIFYADMTGGVFNHWIPMTNSSLPGYAAVGAGDIMRNGYASVVIQNTSNGSILFSNMTGGVFDGWLNVAATPGWNVIAVEDVLGNGFDDIVIQNSTTGEIDYANMTGGSFQGWDSLTSTPGFLGTSQASTTAFTDGSGGDGSSNGSSSQVSSNSSDPLFGGDGGSSDGGGASSGESGGSFGPPGPGSVLGPQVFTAPAPGLASSSGESGALSGLIAQDPTAPNGGSSSGDGNMLSSLIMQQSAAATGIGGTADLINDQNGSPSAALLTSANWLTEGAQNGSTPSNGAAQVPGNSGLASNPGSIVTAENLQNLLHSGGGR